MPEPRRPQLPFVDAHHHLWELTRLRYDWLTEPGVPDSPLGDYSALRDDWPAARLAREFEAQSVIKSVHVEAAVSDIDPVRETAWLESVAMRYGWPNAFVVACDLSAHNAQAVVERHIRASARVRGVRARGARVRNHAGVAQSAEFASNLRALSRYDLSYELNASPGALLDGFEVIASAVDVPIMVGHSGYPLQRDEDYFRRWSADLRTLARLDHVACKISGFGMADHKWTIASMRPWVLECLEIFGVDRCVFGTNWPVDSLYSTYSELVDAYRLILSESGLSIGEQASLLSGNAQRLYRI